MAKSKSFFGLRRGSTKSLTFQVNNGQQITKDRVSVVRNPRTLKQQYQRALMSTVMAAYSAMKNIEDHAFEGKSKGSANQREFMRLNLNFLRRNLAADVDAKRSAANCTCFVNYPKTNHLVSNAYIISRGNLRSQQIFGLGTGNSAIEDGYLKIPANFDGHGQSISYGTIFDMFGLAPGMQITLVWNNLGYAEYQRITGSGNAPGWSYIIGDFRYARYVIRKDINPSDNYDGTEDANQLAWAGNFLEDICDTSVSTFVPDLKEDDGSIFVELESSVEHYDASFTGCFGIITSMVDTDERDDSQMVVIDPEHKIAAGYTGLTYDAIPAAWQEDLSVGSSELYLEGGE